MNLRHTSWPLLCLWSALTVTADVPGQDDVHSPAPESPPLMTGEPLKPWSLDEARRRTEDWLSSAYPKDEARQNQLRTIWSADAVPEEAVFRTLEAIHPPAAELLQACRANDLQAAQQAAGKAILPAASPFLKANLGYAYGRWLAQQRQYDLGLQVLGRVAEADTPDPGSVLFFRAVCEFRLLKTAEASDTLRRLEETSAPERYLAVAKLMRLDLDYLNEEGLDLISRVMGDVQRRFELEEVSPKVQEQEKDIIARLDKLIEKLEQQQQGGGGGGGGGAQPAPSRRSSAPASDSRVMRGKGPGEVGKRNLRGESDWGKLPYKEREKMLQELGRDLPAYYREVIEEYFRKLAEESEPREP